MRRNLYSIILAGLLVTAVAADGVPGPSTPTPDRREVAVAEDSTAIEKFPVSICFPQTPRHMRASSMAMDRPASSCEVFEQSSNAYSLQLTRTSPASPSQQQEMLSDRVRDFQYQGSHAADFSLKPFAIAGSEGVEIRFTANSGERTRARIIVLGSQLIEVNARWTSEVAAPVIERFMNSLRPL